MADTSPSQRSLNDGLTETQSVPLTNSHDFSQLFLKDIPDLLYEEGVVRNVILWKKNDDNPLDQEPYWPFDLKYGACICLFNISYFLEVGYNPDAQALVDGLVNSDLVDWGSKNVDCILDGVPEKLIPTIDNLVAAKNLEKMFSIQTEMQWIDKERASNLIIEYPSNILIQELTHRHVDYLDGFWPHKFEGSKAYLHSLMERNFGLGLFLPPEEDPVAWVISSHSCFIAVLFTCEGHRKQGYAQLLCAVMTQNFGEMGIDPRATVLGDNQKVLFTNLGFEPEGNRYYYIGLRPKLL